MLTSSNIRLAAIPDPDVDLPAVEPRLPDSVYSRRLDAVLAAMKKRALDFLVLHADREHFQNFEYLAGFGPRFEEAILVLAASGHARVLLGNECLSLGASCRIPAETVLFQTLSLPNQPIDRLRDLADVLAECGIARGMKIGMVGWKLLSPVHGASDMLDVPHYVARAVEKLAGDNAPVNATDLFIHPEYGVRTVNDADEIAYFEYGAAYASDAVRRLLRELRTGVTEVDLSRMMNSGGMPVSCHTLVLSGERIDLGLVSPTSNPVRLGDRFNCSQGLLGGLTCRTGFAAYGEDDLPAGAKDYLSVVVQPYYATVANWYGKLGVGVAGGDMYDMVQSTYPKEKFGWSLNPGHLVATEEWMSSPIFQGSKIPLRSGMCMQMDIIPVPPKPVYAGANCEDGLAIADEALRADLQARHPAAFARMQKRRAHMEEALGIALKPEILPLSNLAATYRPYMLNKDMALVVRK